MGLSKILTCVILIASASGMASEHIQAGRMFYLIQAGQYKDAIKIYRDEFAQKKKHDFELLQRIGLGILEEGYRSKDPETQVLTFFGAAISGNEQAFYILEEGIKSQQPQLQLVALNLLSQTPSDIAEEALARAVASNFLPIKLEAIHYLAIRKNPLAVSQAECLMYKLPKELRPLFPTIFAMVGSDEAMQLLRRVFSDPSDDVRIAAIVGSAKYGRDDMLPQIRLLASHFNVGQQEACALALGLMKDESSVPKLDKLSRSSTPSVSLAAFQALYSLGRLEMRQQIEKIALQEDLFAIGALGNMPGSEETLFQLTKNPNLPVRINASLALLMRKDARCFPGLCEILIHDPRDLAFIESESIGHAFSAWKVVPSATQNLKDTPIVYELSTALREKALIQAGSLNEKDFLTLADKLFATQQTDLIPTLVRLLESINSDNVIALLQKHQQKLGAPLVRHYCNLALYRLKQTGPYGEILRQWVKEKSHLDLINFRPLVPWEMRNDFENYQLTPKESSRLLVEAFEAFAAQQDISGIEVLVDAIQDGNPKNKYALAGLLIRATQ